VCGLRSRTGTGNFIGGEFVAPSKGGYFENPFPVNGKDLHRDRPHPPGEDIELAPGTPRTGAKHSWGRTSAAERSVMPNKIADRIESNLEMLAVAETWITASRSGRPWAADLPLAVDHFRYFAGAIRAQEGSLSEIDSDTHRLPLPRAAGRGRPDHPWNSPS